MIIDCKELKQQQIPKLKEILSSMGKKPSLAIIQVGDNPASNTYIKNKIKIGDEIGIEVNHFKLHESSPLNEVKKKILSVVGQCDGCILQLPLPQHLKPYEQELLDLIPYDKDVDGLSTHSIGLLHSGRPYHKPCTAQACVDVLDAYNYPLEGSRVLIIGRQNLLGIPLARMMTDRNATVTLAHSKTEDLDWYLSGYKYDVVVSAIGKANFLTEIEADFIIDVGINRNENGKLCGDIDLDSCGFRHATTVGGGMGGIGQLTTINLIKNVIGGDK